MKLNFLITALVFSGVMSIISQKLVSMGSILLSNALIVTILIAYFSNSWYAFILFLIYITGLLVLFGYFLALSPNTYMTAKKCFKAYSFILLPFLFIDHLSLLSMPMTKMSFEKSVTYVCSSLNLPIYLFMTLILLLALLMVVSITFKSPSPLRNYLK